MKRSFFTFGQKHQHRYRGLSFDKDTVVEIKAERPRDVMFQCFGNKWSMEYDKLPDPEYFDLVVMIREDGRILGSYMMVED